MQGARAALRRFREDRAAGAAAPPRAPGGGGPAPWRLTLDLPLPVAPGIAAGGLPLEESPFGLADEGDWPGGPPQRFRALRQVVDRLLEGYGAEFVGALEDPADGLGAWRVGGDATVVGVVYNATFEARAPGAPLGCCLRCYGVLRARPRRSSRGALQTLPRVRAPPVVCQAVRRGLRVGPHAGGPRAHCGGRVDARRRHWAAVAAVRRAAAAGRAALARVAAMQGALRARRLIDDGGWAPLYAARMVRTSRGSAFGCLTGGWGEPWRLYPGDDGVAPPRAARAGA